MIHTGYVSCVTPISIIMHRNYCYINSFINGLVIDEYS